MMAKSVKFFSTMILVVVGLAIGASGANVVNASTNTIAPNPNLGNWAASGVVNIGSPASGAH